MRRHNDQLMWLFEALDVVTPSVYLGVCGKQSCERVSVHMCFSQCRCQTLFVVVGSLP